MRARHPFVLVSGLAVLLGACGNSAPVSVDATLLSVNTTSAVVGGHGKIRLSFTNPLGDGADVALSSSDESVIRIAATANVPAGAISAEVQYDAMALGQAFINARFKDTNLTVAAAVVDQIKPTGSSSGRLEVGANGLLTVYVNAVVPDPFEVSLTPADAAIVDAPSSVTIAPFSSYYQARITGKAAGSTTITAAAGGSSTSSVVQVVDHARLSGVSGAAMTEAGSSATIYVSLDAIVAKSTTVMATSSNPSVSAPPVVVIPAGSSSTQLKLPILAAGITDLTFTLADSTYTVRVAAVDKARLQSFYAPSNITPGLTSYAQAYLDATVATERTVMLTSSDPTVAAVPDKIVIAPQTSSGSVSIAGLKQGDAVITATMDGVVWKRAVHVGFDNSSLSLSLRSNIAAVGAIDELSIQLGGTNSATMVSLTSSDPTVAAVPASLTVSSSSVIPLTALKVGRTTLTATANGLSYSIDLTVVAVAAFQQFGPYYNVRPGQSTSGYIYFSALPAPGTRVSFTSSDATVVAPPNDFAVTENNTYAYFTLNGLKSGTAILTATLSGGASVSAAVYVGGESSPPSLYNNLGINGTRLQVGAVGYAQVFMSQPPSQNVDVTFTLSAPGIVALPQTTGIVAAGSQYLYFPIVGSAAGTVDVSATIGTVKKSVTVTVVATPTFTISVPANTTVGNVVIGSVSSNCVLAANNTFDLASSMTGFATVSAPTLTLAPGQDGATADFAVTGVAAGMANITATQGATVLTAPITVAP